MTPSRSITPSVPFKKNVLALWGMKCIKQEFGVMFPQIERATPNFKCYFSTTTTTTIIPSITAGICLDEQLVDEVLEVLDGEFILDFVVYSSYHI